MNINYKSVILNFEPIPNSLPRNYDIYVDFDDKVCIIEIDTRDNTISYLDRTYSKYLKSVYKPSQDPINEYNRNILNAIVDNFEKFKKTDFRYGNIKTGDQPGYSPSRNIEIIDFLNYLKSKNREELIDKII